jgi:thiosulfate reductase cytochrome b subunit
MQRVYINPLPVRIWHWTNAIGFVLLILTGLQIRYVGIVDVMSFKTAVTLHNGIGFVLIAAFTMWLGFYLLTDKGQVYYPELNPKKYYRATFKQMMYYGFGIFRGDPNPHHTTAYSKFNALQGMMYQLIMLLIVPLLFYTGILLWNPSRFEGQIAFFGGVRIVDTIHVLIFIFFCSFLVIHMYLATLGHTALAHYKAMITGYEEEEEEEHEAAASADGAKNSA